MVKTTEHTTAREKLLGSALELMLRQGYSGTTVDEICGRAGVSKGSFYHFFPTKEDLALAALEQYFRLGVAKLTSGPQAAEVDPRQRALGMVEHTKSVSEDLWSKGCLLGNFAMEISESNPKLRDRVSRAFESLTQSMAAQFEAIVSDAGEGPTATDLAEMFLEVIEGAIVLAKAHRDPTRIPKAVASFQRYLALLTS
jgi:TetR/AcrR family transcriptional repressor of nem operon